MLIRNHPPLHLTYCLNIHPGETWAENLAAIRTHATKVRDRLAGGKSFALGLRLGAVAARELSDPVTLAAFRVFLQDENLYAATVNGFPYGKFHGAAVKEKVYRPDWQDPRRRNTPFDSPTSWRAFCPRSLSPASPPCPARTRPGSSRPKTSPPWPR